MSANPEPTGQVILADSFLNDKYVTRLCSTAEKTAQGDVCLMDRGIVLVDGEGTPVDSVEGKGRFRASQVA